MQWRPKDGSKLPKERFKEHIEEKFCPEGCLSGGMASEGFTHTRTKTDGYIIRESAERQQFQTGAQRDDQTGKGRYDLLPPMVLMRDAAHYEKGAMKYNDWNWTKGIPSKRYMESAFRHLVQYMLGDRVEDHLAAVRFNVGGIMFNEWAVENGYLPPELHDLKNFIDEARSATRTQTPTRPETTP